MSAPAITAAQRLKNLLDEYARDGVELPLDVRLAAEEIAYPPGAVPND